MQFLALLELYKQGRVELDQGETFGDLRSWPETGRSAGGRRQRPRAGRARRSSTTIPRMSARGRTERDELNRGDRGGPDWSPSSRSRRGLLAELLEEPVERVEEALRRARASSTSAERRGFVLARVAGGYRLQSQPDLAPYVERFALEGVPHRLSPAALETLAIVAYKQPVSRAQISSIRGVNVDGVDADARCSTATSQEVGHADGPGQAVLLRHDRALPRAARARQRRRPAAAEQFVPGPRDGRATGARPALGARLGRGGDRRRRGAEASGCRRCWRVPGSAAGAPARSSIEAGRVEVERRRGHLGRRVDTATATAWRSTARRSGCPGPRLLPAQQARRGRHDGRRPAGPADGARARPGRAARLPGRAPRLAPPRGCSS